MDPGSSDKGTACVEVTLEANGQNWSMGSVKVYERQEPKDLKEKLEGWKLSKNPENSALLVWDAPLTGPRFPEEYESKSDGPVTYKPGDFTLREIEVKLQDILDHKRTNAINKFPGISVLGYGSGCPHMPITQHMLGLPRIGRFHADYCNLPFYLLSEHQDSTAIKAELAKNACVVETHPAVAMWGWLHPDLEKPELALISNRKSWRYKGTNINKNLDTKEPASGVRECLLNALIKRWKDFSPDLANGAESIRDKAIKDDNIFDALIAAVLGVLAVTSDKEVKLYGSQSTGAMLLPVTDNFNKALNALKPK